LSDDLALKGGAELSLPNCLYLEITNRCNLRCRGCIQYRGGWEQERDMSLQEIIMITDQVPGLERAVLHGIGEPLLNERLPAMIRHLRNRNVIVNFNSNGTLLNKEWQKTLIETGLDELHISLDAASANCYTAVRGIDKFDLIVSNVASFSESLKRKRISNPRLSFWFIGSKRNMSELPNLIRLAAKVGVKEVYLQRLVYFLDGERYGLARPDETLRSTDSEASRLIKESQVIADRVGVQFSASGLREPALSIQGEAVAKSPWRRCYRPSSLMYITANGNVLPCCISPFSTTDYNNIILGNVFESSLADVWFGRKYQLFRKCHQTTLPPKSCRGCGVHWSL
jgi:radical SAM protein with 4Fe4S-binding SPASM domain